MSSKSGNSRRLHSERGVYVVLTLLLLSVLLAMIALVFAIGFQSINKAKLQNISNMVAWAGVESYSSSTASSVCPAVPASESGCTSCPTGTGPNDVFLRKRCIALARANHILRENSLLGARNVWADDPLTTGTSSQSGQLQLGHWYTEAPAGNPTVCAHYPCFLPYPDAATTAPVDPLNAVRVNIRTPSPLLAPLLKLFNRDGYTIKSEATATVVQRCTAFLLDVSTSVSVESHPYIINTDSDTIQDFNAATWVANTDEDGTPPGRAELEYASYPSYRTDAPIAGKPGGGVRVLQDIIDGVSECRLRVLQEPGEPPPPVEVPNGIEYPYGFMWCAVKPSRQAAYSAGTLDGDVRRHYRDDYEVRTSYRLDGAQQQLRYDTRYQAPYGGPEPYVTFLRAFNAGVRGMINQRIAGDRVMIMPFAGDVFRTGGTTPGIRKLGPTSDLGLAAQVTNYLNVGLRTFDGGSWGPATDVQGGGATIVTSQEIHPNVFDYSLIPWTGTAGTASDSHGGTFLAGALHHARQELLSTTNCPIESKKSIVVASDGITNCRFPSMATRTGSVCGDSFNDYLLAEAQTLTVLGELKEDDIPVTVLVSADYIGTHYKNIKRNGQYIDFLEASGRGLGGITKPDSRYHFINMDGQENDGPAEAAYANIFRSTSNFYRALGLLVSVATDTGGIFCPLLSPGPETDYIPAPSGYGPKILDPAKRTEGASEYRSALFLTRPQQASDCVQRSIGLNPYTLVEVD